MDGVHKSFIYEAVNDMLGLLRTPLGSMTGTKFNGRLPEYEPKQRAPAYACIRTQGCKVITGKRLLEMEKFQISPEMKVHAKTFI